MLFIGIESPCFILPVSCLINVSLLVFLRDLKPENLLLTSPSDDADIKIVDFGFAIEIEGLNCTSQVGTPGYIAPEILNKVSLFFYARLRNRYNKCLLYRFPMDALPTCGLLE